jgi:Secretion system C-terminal sorting domain
MKKIIIFCFSFCCFIKAYSQEIDGLSVTKSNNDLIIYYKLFYALISNFQSRITINTTVNGDTINFKSYSLYPKSGANVTGKFDTTIVLNNIDYSKLCYFNLITHYDTNSNPTYFPYTVSYPLDTMSHDFKHCWPLGINNNNNLEIQLYPNPCAHFLNISNLGNGISNINIVNVQGQIVPASWHWNGSNININTSNLLPGLYFLKLESEDGIKYQKFRKE